MCLCGAAGVSSDSCDHAATHCHDAPAPPPTIQDLLHAPLISLQTTGSVPSAFKPGTAIHRTLVYRYRGQLLVQGFEGFSSTCIPLSPPSCKNAISDAMPDTTRSVLNEIPLVARPRTSTNASQATTGVRFVAPPAGTTLQRFQRQRDRILTSQRRWESIKSDLPPQLSRKHSTSFISRVSDRS